MTITSIIILANIFWKVVVLYQIRANIFIVNKIELAEIIKIEILGKFLMQNIFKRQNT